METTLGPYRIQQYLGSLNVGPDSAPFISKGLKKGACNRIALGLREITSMREILRIEKNFQAATNIKIDLRHGFEYYRVSLVADFFHQDKEFRFTYALVKAEENREEEEQKSVSGPWPQIYSISPRRVDEETHITKQFGINPQLQLTPMTISGGSYTHKKEYEQLHPQILGHYSARQAVHWEFMTTDSINDITGAQLVEFMVKQPSDMKSAWIATPEAKFNWATKKDWLKAGLFGKSLPSERDNFEEFYIPSRD